jgi:translation elongation factor EF-Tu-like GTPase
MPIGSERLSVQKIGQDKYGKDYPGLNLSMTDRSSFMMVIDDVFTVKGRGIIVVGRVQSGNLRKGDAIFISGKDRPTIATRVTAFEGFIRDHDSFVAQPGDNCAILLHEVEINQIETGMIITDEPPNS